MHGMQWKQMKKNISKALIDSVSQKFYHWCYIIFIKQFRKFRKLQLGTQTKIFNKHFA